jgi:hypothetical protein
MTAPDALTIASEVLERMPRAQQLKAMWELVLPDHTEAAFSIKVDGRIFVVKVEQRSIR